MTSKFRKLNDGYEYQIGRRFVCIRNKDIKYRVVIPKEDVGISYGNPNNPTVMVTPGAIAYWLEHGKRQPDEMFVQYKCSCNSPKTLCWDPYQDEIYRKKILCYLCEKCLHELEMDI